MVPDIVSYREAPLRGPTPYSFIYHFGKKGTPSIYLLLQEGTPFTHLPVTPSYE